MPDEHSGPYAAAAWQYRKAGWQGVIPIGRRPAQKDPPPTGYTGYAGLDPSGPDVQAWIDGPEGAYNIGLHLPRGVYVIDVDERNGGVQGLEELQRRAGVKLPPTITSTARGQHQPSRHHFYRATLPEGRVWRDHPAQGLDSLHVGHRYAVTWPSINPKTGTIYETYDETGELYEGAFTPGDLAELPIELVMECSKPGEPMKGEAASDTETLDVIKGFRVGEPCPRVTKKLNEELARIAGAASAALHDPGPLFPLVAYGIEGHAGVGAALSIHQAAYVAARVAHRGQGSESASADWWRQVRGAVGKKLANDDGKRCRCGEPPAEDVNAPGEAEPGFLDKVRNRQEYREKYVDRLAFRLADKDAKEALDKADNGEDVLGDLRAATFNRESLNEIPRPEQLIDGILTHGAYAVLAGKSQSMKSFTALDWSLSIASGKPWLGLHKVVHSGPVLYVAAEGVSGIKDRLHAWEVVHNAGRPVAADTFHLVTQAVNISKEPHRAALATLAKEIGAVLVVIDTLRRCTAGVDENSNTEMSAAITSTCDAVRLACGATTLFVHHTGHGAERSRGASCIEYDADLVWHIKRDDEAGPGRTLTQPKTKDAEPVELVKLRFTPVQHTRSGVLVLAAAGFFEFLDSFAPVGALPVDVAAFLNPGREITEKELEAARSKCNREVKAGRLIKAPAQPDKLTRYLVTAAARASERGQPKPGTTRQEDGMYAE